VSEPLFSMMRQNYINRIHQFYLNAFFVLAIANGCQFPQGLN
jgi:hypothetical protein